MSRDVVVAVVKNPWWAIVGLAFSLGASISAFQSHETSQDKTIAAKADSASIAELTRTVNRLDERLRAFICDGKPRYCQ